MKRVAAIVAAVLLAVFGPGEGREFALADEPAEAVVEELLEAAVGRWAGQACAEVVTGPFGPASWWATRS